MYLVKSPQLLRSFYPSLTWHMPRSEKIVYLTFDDGPIPDVTDYVLKTLNTFGARATFFCIGENIIKHPSVFKSVLDNGHSIGNHTFNHLKGWDTSNELYVENMLKCQALTNTNLFRPPYGRIKRAQIKMLREQFSVFSAHLEVGSSQFAVNSSQYSNPQASTFHPARRHDEAEPSTQRGGTTKQNPPPSPLNIVMWDVLSGDFDTTISAEKCYQNVVKHAENGSIIVFHDSLKAFDRLKHALPKALKYFKENGYQFGVL